jgi:membrane fusion protein (multidrug efflux system)
MNRFPWMLIGALVGCVVLSGCKPSQDSGQREPVRVEVQQVMTADSRQSLAYSGTIEESETIPLSFSSIGTVSQVLVSEGDAVSKGQLLATLDTATFRNAYEMAHAAEQQAEDAYQRLTPMHQNGNLPEVKYVEVKTGLQQAKAAAAIAKKSLDDCNLVATTAGIVGKRSIQPGMVALPNVTSITLVKISKVYAKVSVPENEISSIKKGDQATIIIGALGTHEYSGAVEEIGVLADPLVHTYKIKIGVANMNRVIKPGMICNVTVDNINTHHGLVVPSRAVMVDETGRNFVYTVDSASNKAAKREVQTGDLLNSGIEILGGIHSNDRVVVAGQHKLVDDASVQIVP